MLGLVLCSEAALRAQPVLPWLSRSAYFLSETRLNRRPLRANPSQEVEVLQDLTSNLVEDLDRNPPAYSCITHLSSFPPGMPHGNLSECSQERNSCTANLFPVTFKKEGHLWVGRGVRCLPIELKVDRIRHRICPTCILPERAECFRYSRLNTLDEAGFLTGSSTNCFPNTTVQKVKHAHTHTKEQITYTNTLALEGPPQHRFQEAARIWPS